MVFQLIILSPLTQPPDQESMVMGEREGRLMKRDQGAGDTTIA